MTDREKLIELLNKAHAEYYAKCDFSKGYMATLADYLLANGVTFATDTNDGCKWISVEDELPEATYQVLTVDDEGWIEIDALGGEDWFSYRNVTHWMPLPEPLLDTTNQAADL